ncbi:hypothetical protein PVAND_009806 [Polypedilum vanderplanki]|uniref:Uncharacterized protein n=1 Tax=Polypedilum vanderplanki TaxID=319348 RepID=A0A9J6CEP5_POLVA|nr:hypothetical protein PVAND_009806 [Polypedilum vanderplanki]
MHHSTFNKITKIWSGPKVLPIFNPDQNLGELIVKVLEQTPDAITQISADTNVSLTCGEMRNRILKIAFHLNDLELKQGDVVGVITENTENIAPVVFACFLLGLPVNPLASVMIESDIAQIYSKTKPKLIFCDEKNLKTVQNAVKIMKSEAKIYTVMEKVDGYESVTKVLEKIVNFEDFIYPEVDPNSIIFIPCTSGSTGLAKGIGKTHKEIIFRFVPSSLYNPNGPNVLFQSTAIFWFSGIYFLIYGALYKCLRITTAQSVTPELIVEIIKKYKVTNVSTAPYLIVNLLQLTNLKPFETIKMWMIPGATATQNLCERLKKYVPNGVVSSFYGSTECDIISSNSREKKFGSCGEIFYNNEVKIINDNENSIDCNQKGEICVKNIVKFTGYYNDIEKTNEVYDGEWFKTGDIGYIDDEGLLYVIDRKKDILKYNNMQVAPLELEAIINEIDGVINCCVVGVSEKNTGNDIIHAFVITNESKNLTSTGIEDYINSKVIDVKKIRGGVHFIKNIPLTASGKIDRKMLRKLASEKFTK